MSPACERNEIRRSRRIQEIVRRSSSLGENSDTNHFADPKLEVIYSSKKPKMTIGVIADIQHAPIPDGYSYSGVPRYYQHALNVARIAAGHFEREKVDLMVNLGDIVDGKCQNVDGPDPGQRAFENVIQALSVYKSGPVLHAYGNHCLYNLDREAIGKALGIPFKKEPCGDLVGYGSHTQNGLCFITLDSYDIALMRRCDKTSQKYKEAKEILSKCNPNFGENENSPDGLTGVKRRYVAFNGAVGTLQLQWLRSKLLKAKNMNQKVIILSHQPILPGSSSPVCLMWNYNEVLALLRQFSDIILASFSGHAHKGGYRRDKSGIHFRVFEAVLESPYPHTTYAMVDVHDDRIEVRGFGDCKSAVYDCDHVTACVEK